VIVDGLIIIKSKWANEADELTQFTYGVTTMAEII
jgi:hypothetical protein